MTQINHELRYPLLTLVGDLVWDQVSSELWYYVAQASPGSIEDQMLDLQRQVLAQILSTNEND